MDTKLEELLLKQIQKTSTSTAKPDIWTPDVKYFALKKLTIDERGRNGQEFLQKVFNLAGYKTQGDNEKTGDWDIKIGNKRIEVKTAMMDRSFKFQHESVHKTNNYDYIMFLDIAPNEIYFSVCKYENIPWAHLHERGNDSDRTKRVTGAGFKWDINYKSLSSPRLPKHHGVVGTVDDIKNIFEACVENK